MVLTRAYEMRGAIHHDMATGAITLHPRNALFFELDADGTNHASVVDARLLRKGGIHLLVRNVDGGANNVEVRDPSASVIATVAPGETWMFCLKDNSTENGDWLAKEWT